MRKVVVLLAVLAGVGVVCEKSTEQKPSHFQGLAARCACRFRPSSHDLFGLMMESMNALPLQFLMLIFAGWVNRHQQDVLE